MTALGPFETCPDIAVAFSGGPDSKALLLLCHSWLKSHYTEFNLTALIVDHHLRHASSHEAYLSHQWCNKQGITAHILDWQHDGKAKSMQAARQARYDLLTNYCHQQDILHLLVGHHSADQDETIIINILRGTGIKGLQAMKNITYMNGISILRPLLGFSKPTLISYLRQQNLTWIDDPSNQNCQYQRARVRQFLQSENLPTWRLSEMAANMASIDQYMQNQLNSFILEKVMIARLGYLRIDIASFRKLEPQLGLRLLTQALKVISPVKTSPRFASIKNCYEKIISNIYGKITIHACIVKHDSHYIWLYQEPAAITKLIKTSPSLDNNFIKVKEDSNDLAIVSSIGTDFIKNHIKNTPKEVIFAYKSVADLENLPTIAYIYRSNNDDEELRTKTIFKPKYSLS